MKNRCDAKLFSLALALLVSSCLFHPNLIHQVASAQQAETWVTVSPEGEDFTAEMPLGPFTERDSESSATNLYYVTDVEGITYSIWSVKGTLPHPSDEPDSTFDYLDNLVEFYWESLMQPQRQKLSSGSSLTYERDLAMQKTVPAREYRLVLGKRSGLARFYKVKTDRGYVVTVVGVGQRGASGQRFLDSFRIKNSDSSAGASSGKTEAPDASSEESLKLAAGAGRGGNSKQTESTQSESKSAGTDYHKIFTGREVTQKLRILSKPEPTYTEQARKYQIRGTIALRAVFSSSGEVTNIKVLKSLPHGLTAKAIAVARAIRFEPALKDGRPVSMFMQLEYNFNLF
jgi:TonB family protein